MTDFLVLARAPDGEFYEFVRALIFGLRELGLDRLYNIRPYTNVIASRNFVDLQERPLTASTSPIDESLLVEPESESLEFKATFAANLRRYVATGEKHGSADLVDAVVRAVCGLLNSPRGGRLVIGVLELSREVDRHKGDKAAFIDQLSAEFPHIDARTSDGVSDPRVILGLEFDYELGRPFKDWDTFVRHLEQLMRERITPLPLPFIEIERLMYEGRTVAVITARPSDRWFWAEADGGTHFYVRELGSTRNYVGPDADLYRETHPRHSRYPYPQA